MATNGQVNTNTEYESYFWVKWEQVGNQDVENNRTQIKWTCGLYSEHKFGSNAVKMSAFSINGTQVYKGGTYSNYKAEGNQDIATGTMWINHNTDGTKTFTISSFTGWLYSNHNYSSSGGSFALTNIPRQAKITSAPNFTDLDNPTISYSNPAGSSVAALSACISLTGSAADIAYRDISKTGTSYQFPLTDAERDLLRNNTGISRKIRFHLRTKIGSTYFYDVKEVTFTVKESDATKPAVTMYVTLNNSLLPDAFKDIYVQGKSKVDVSLKATGQYKATIDSYSAEVDGKTYNSSEFTSDVIQTSGSQKVKGYAKDSRKFTGSASKTINVIEYSKPLVIPLSSENAIQCFRSDGNGNRVGNSTSLWIKAGRSFHSVSGKNKCRLHWRWKKASEPWDDKKHLWVELLEKNAATDEYNAQVDGVFNLTDAYTVQIGALDDIGENDIKTFDIPTRDVALHLGKGGKNVAVGTYCDYSEERTFYSDWKAIFDKEVYIGGTQVSDHVMEQGTKDGWTYRKWQSGIAECWYRKEHTIAITTAWGNLYAGTSATGRTAYPFAFKEKPHETVTVKSSDPSVFAVCSSSGSGDNTVSATASYNAVRPSAVTDPCTVFFDYYVVGRWK